MILKLSDLTAGDIQNYLQHAIAPRPIAFASTINAAGDVNLSPFSFFNLFSSNPPIVVFSPARRGRDNSIKHTLENVQEVAEVGINIVDYDMVQQMSLSSTEYDRGVNEFLKAGFTEQPSTMIKPPLVAESKIKMECKVLEIKPLGAEGGAGNLVIAEVLVLHVADEILDDNQKIDQQKIEHVARLGGNWYCRVNPSNLFEVEKPLRTKGVGVDKLPDHIKKSKVLTGNSLGQLANVEEIPEPQPAFHLDALTDIVTYFSLEPAVMEAEIHGLVNKLLEESRVEEGWQVLLAAP